MQQQPHCPAQSGSTVILVGTGDLAETLTAVYQKYPLPPAVAGFSVKAWVRDASTPCAADACIALAFIPEYPDCQTAFAAFPNIEFVCDLTNDGSGFASAAAIAPPGATLVPAAAVKRICEAALNTPKTEESEFSDSFFAGLIDQFDEELIVVDTTGKVICLNSHLLAVWGGKKEDYIGKHCSELSMQDLSCADSKPFFEAVLEAGQRITETYTTVAADGRMHYFYINAFPLRDRHGHIRYLALARRDTTAQAQIEQRLYQSQKMAAIGELSTYIAHEIRNPLFAIGGFANALLRMPSLDGAALEKARIILEESQRLDEILKSIINFTRPTEQTLGDVDLNTVVAQTVEILNFGSEHSTPIALELGRNIPKIYGNTEMLKQCLINLVKNAQEAMDGKGTIRVRTRSANALVHLEVEDDGPGIPLELQEQIFSPFFSTKGKGAGLGLAMTRKIINEIGGQLFLYSKVGEGTLVSMTLRPALAVPLSGLGAPGA